MKDDILDDSNLVSHLSLQTHAREPLYLNYRQNMSVSYKKLPIEQLSPGRFQPRQSFDREQLQELAHSIRNQGLLEPLIVREISRQPVEAYEIVAGERRWRAAMLAELSEIPCLIGDYRDEQVAAISLIENIQRQDLNLYEEACGYQRMISEFHFHQEDVAVMIGKSRSHIANVLRLLSLCEPAKERLRTRQLSLGHARMLVGLSEQQQIELMTHIFEHDWSVRRLEEAVRALKTVTPTKPVTSSQRDVVSLQNQLAEQVGAPVQIDAQGQEGGWLKIKFFSNETLEGLLERLGLGYDQSIE